MLILSKKPNTQLDYTSYMVSYLLDDYLLESQVSVDLERSTKYLAEGSVSRPGSV